MPTPCRHRAPAAAVLSLLLSAGSARAAEPVRGAGPLHQLDAAVAALAARVTPAVVQIEVSGFALADPHREETAVVARQHTIGSGVVVDPSGYILTNAHVVRGAQRITVVLATPPGRLPTRADSASRRVFSARVVGSEPGVDLALLKVEATGLSHLPLDGSARVRQGELVFAIGSPQGLASTITMGVVGSPGRQVDFAPPLAYIQTDAPINPGNSGGPLVDVDGALVGINTFIVSQSGGSQGLGFAIPAAMARFVYEQLRASGRVHRTELGLATQSISPRLAAGLGLPRDWGVVVADVVRGGAAQAAGVQVGDVIDSLDGQPIESLATVATAAYMHPVGTPMALVLLRGGARLSLQVDAPEARPSAEQLLELTSPEAGLVRKLGIVGLDYDERLSAALPPLAIASGVVVAARTLDGTSLETPLQAGDVIHMVNHTPVASVQALRQALRTIEAGAPVVLQLERQGKLAFVAFDME